MTDLICQNITAIPGAMTNRVLQNFKVLGVQVHIGVQVLGVQVHIVG